MDEGQLARKSANAAIFFTRARKHSNLVGNENKRLARARVFE